MNSKIGRWISLDRKKISIIGVPSDYGQQRRGVDMGPSAMRYAGAIERLEKLGYDVIDEGDISVHRTKRNKQYDGKLLNLEEVLEVSERLAKKVDEVIKQDRFPVILGGDHSISIGSIAGIRKHYQNLGIIWFDAHTDINTPETTPSGNIHGMPLAVNLGLGDHRLISIAGNAPKLKFENIVFIGARSIDEGEKALIKEKNIKIFTMHEIDRMGMSKVIEETVEYLKARHVDGVHMSIDLDALDPIFTPGVGTPVPGGITYRESHLAMEMLEEAKMITSCEFVEVNPILDERNKTANTAVALMGSLLGEKLV
ncbi:arginase [Ureibacillus sp. FSL K6-8385]|uniref:Arginase n=1 Tax=Ureibacillus terrenus TaxID=118246 RepID=A0A540UWK0_9BACL|nr:arginase [Ureibacillus terrenus]MED3662764.1 arginase [Ureibacillus terrenus]MED3763421.1 arginase [Ureibacillus terrenus]TQE88817.1 arginase [Ureibacillus terrenus]